jgi:RNA polymerase sigma-70 factor (ECF subfamily)
MDPVTELSDEMLMAQLAQGQRAAMDVLIRRWANPLLAFLLRMIGERATGEEVFQEVFLAVWNKRQQYEFPRPFRSWLFAIAVNKCREAGRVRRLAAGPFDKASSLAPARGPTPEALAVATETASLVTSAVQRLPAQQRAVVVLRIWHDLSYDEIAGIVGRSESTVRSHMHHGLAGLRKFLEPRLSDFKV